MFITFKSYMKKHLQWQILIPMLGLFVLCGVAGIYLIYTFLEDDYSERLLARGKILTHSIQFAAESASTLGGIQRFVAAVGAEDDVNLVVIVAGKERKIISSTKLEYIGKPSSVLRIKSFSVNLLKSLDSRKTSFKFNENHENYFVSTVSHELRTPLHL